MAMEFFPCYDSYFQKLSSLTDEEVGRLFRALMLYHITGEREQINGRESLAYDFIIYEIDRARDMYEERCKKNRRNIEKRWDSDTNEYDSIQSNTNAYDPIQSYTNDTKAKAKAKAKANNNSGKHAHGEYKNVLITDQELDKLINDYGEDKANSAIEFYSSYLAEKGDKSKSHYLTIRRWVFSALEEREQKKPKAEYGGKGGIGDAEREALELLMGGP